MSYSLLLDWYTNKIIYLWCEDAVSFKVGEKIVYTIFDAKTQAEKKSIGTFIKMVSEKEIENYDLIGSFCHILEGEEKQYFDEKQKEASDLFLIFKKEFKEDFPDAVPIVARYQIFSHQLFLYFYSEERFIFTEFVKKLREKIQLNIFLFQVGARDMIRMSPQTDYVYCNADVKLCCKHNILLNNVEIENVVLQNLEGRDIEKLKWRCGKLKCCLLYEINHYLEEWKKYPQKWSKITLQSSVNCRIPNCEDKEICEGIVLSFNIMNQEIKIKTKDGIIRVTLDKLNS